MNRAFHVWALTVLSLSVVIGCADGGGEPIGGPAPSTKPFSGSLPPEEVGVIPEADDGKVSQPEASREPAAAPDSAPAQTLPPPP